MRQVPSSWRSTTWLRQILSKRVRGSAIVVLALLFGAWRLVRRLAGLARPFDDAGALAGASAQIIELGAPRHATPHHLDRRDARRMQRKDALDPLAVGNLAQREVRVDAGVFAGDADALEGLHALALALDHLDADAHRIARLEFRHAALGDQSFDLFALQFLEQ